eukprot:1663661-Rhodomonas_salina.3
MATHRTVHALCRCARTHWTPVNSWHDGVWTVGESGLCYWFSEDGWAGACPTSRTCARVELKTTGNLFTGPGLTNPEQPPFSRA